MCIIIVVLINLLIIGMYHMQIPHLLSFVFKATNRMHIYNSWVTIANVFIAMNFYKMTKYTTKMTETE